MTTADVIHEKTNIIARSEHIDAIIYINKALFADDYTKAQMSVYGQKLLDLLNEMDALFYSQENE